MKASVRDGSSFPMAIGEVGDHAPHQLAIVVAVLEMLVRAHMGGKATGDIHPADLAGLLNGCQQANPLGCEPGDRIRCEAFGSFRRNDVGRCHTDRRREVGFGRQICIGELG
jgi:hypothetical protein